jgi:hypothetical protein
MWTHPREGESVGCQNRLAHRVLFDCGHGHLWFLDAFDDGDAYRPTGRTCGDQNGDGSDEKSFQIGSTGGNQV